MINPSVAPALSPAPASAGDPAAAAPSVDDLSGAFAAIFSEAAAVSDPTSALPAAQVATVKAPLLIDPGKATGKVLPDIAVALMPDLKAAPEETGEADTASDAPADTSLEIGDGSAADPADTLLAVLAVLPPIPVNPNISAPVLSAKALLASGPVSVQVPVSVQAPVSVQVQTLPATTANPAAAVMGDGAPLQTALAALTPLPSAKTPPRPVGTGTAPDIALPAAPAQPVVTALPEEVRLGPIAVVSAQNPKAAAMAAPPSGAPILATEQKSPTTAQPPVATASAAVTTTNANPALAAAQLQADNPARQTSTPLATPLATQALSTNEPHPAPASAPTERLAELPALARAASSETAQPLTLSPATAPVPVTTAGAAASQAEPQGPQDFATLVGKIAEAREAAGAQVVAPRSRIVSSARFRCNSGQRAMVSPLPWPAPTLRSTPPSTPGLRPRWPAR